MTKNMRVLYNGDCPICAREIGAYARMAETDGLPLGFDDLNGIDLARWGVSDEDARRRLHVLADGWVISGLPAFLALWARMPRLAWIARLIDRPVLRPSAAFVYDRILAPALYRFDRRRRRRAAARHLP